VPPSCWISPRATGGGAREPAASGRSAGAGLLGVAASSAHGIWIISDRALLWLIFLVLGILISLQAQLSDGIFPKDFIISAMARSRSNPRAWVFLGTMGLLIVPKTLGLPALRLPSPEIEDASWWSWGLCGHT